jgi:hypothetical protein
MELTPVLIGIASAVVGYILIEAIKHFFSPNKKVSRIEFNERMKEVEEKMSSHKTINDERSAACEKRCRNYTDRAIANSDEKRVLEMKRIEDLIVLNGKQNRAILEGVRDSIKSIDIRLGKIEDKKH